MPERLKTWQTIKNLSPFILSIGILACSGKEATPIPKIIAPQQDFPSPTISTSTPELTATLRAILTSTPIPQKDTPTEIPTAIPTIQRTPTQIRPRLIDVLEAGIKAPPRNDTLGASSTKISATITPEKSAPQLTPTPETAQSSEIKVLLSQEIKIPTRIPGWFEPHPFTFDTQFNPQVLYFANKEGKITSYSISDEKLRQIFETKGEVIDGGKGTVYIRNGDNNLVSMSTESGREKWNKKYDVEGFNGAPVRVYTKGNILQITYVDGKKPVGNNTYTVFADIENGNKLWSTPGYIIKTSTNVAFINGVGGFDIKTGNKLYEDTYKPNEWQDNLYIPDEPVIYAEGEFKNGTRPGIVAFNIDTGKPIWTREKRPDESRLSLNARLMRKWMFITSNFPNSQNQQLIALNPQNGSEVWRSQILNTPVNVSEFEGNVIVYDTNNKLTYMIDQTTGKPIWNNPLRDIAFNSFRGFYNNVLVLAAQDMGPRNLPTTIAGIERQTGKIIWRLDVPYNGINSSTAVIGKIVIAEGGKIKVLSVQDKKELASFQTGTLSTLQAIGSTQVLTISGKSGQTGKITIFRA